MPGSRIYLTRLGGRCRVSGTPYTRGHLSSRDLSSRIAFSFGDEVVLSSICMGNLRISFECISVCSVAVTLFKRRRIEPSMRVT